MIYRSPLSCFKKRSPSTAPENGDVYAIQYSTIPVGILLGGYLADYVFEPFLRSGTGVAVLLQHVVGNSAGSGMAAMFLCTGILGFSVSFLSCFNRQIRKLDAGN